MTVSARLGRLGREMMATASSPNLDWLVSVDDHVLEPGDVWTSRLPKKYVDIGPRIVQDGTSEFWVYEDKRNPTAGLSAVAGKAKEEFSPEPVTYRGDAARLLQPHRSSGGHGSGWGDLVAVFPVVSSILRSDLLRGRRQGVGAAVCPGVQRLDDRRVVWVGSRPIDPLGDHSSVGPEAGGQGDGANGRQGRAGVLLFGEPGSVGSAHHS